VITVATSRYQAGEKIVTSGLVPVGITVGSPRFKIDYRDTLVYVREAHLKGLTRWRTLTRCQRTTFG
jgi:hypothetical protein